MKCITCGKEPNSGEGFTHLVPESDMILCNDCVMQTRKYHELQVAYDEIVIELLRYDGLFKTFNDILEEKKGI